MKVREIQVSYRTTKIEIADTKCEGSERVAEIFAFLKDADREKFCTLHLSARCKVLGFEIVSIGTTTESFLSPREVFKSALLHNAVSMVLVHNHPSGDPTPSHEDKIVTARLKKAAKLLGLTLLDHVIIGYESYFSFADEGIL